MVFGSIREGDSAGREASILLPPVLKTAIDYLSKTDFSVLKEGEMDVILAGVKVKVQIHDLATEERKAKRPEIHRKFVDVQFLAKGGPEAIGVYHEDGKGVIDEDLLNTPRDILFYKGGAKEGESTIVMEEGSWVIFFPWDVHTPGCMVGSEGCKVRKIVIKVPLEACM